MSNIEGLYSIYFYKKMERSLRLVGVLAPTPRRAIPAFVTRHSLLVASHLLIFSSSQFLSLQLSALLCLRVPVCVCG